MPRWMGEGQQWGSEERVEAVKIVQTLENCAVTGAQWIMSYDIMCVSVYVTYRHIQYYIIYNGVYITHTYIYSYKDKSFKEH